MKKGSRVRAGRVRRPGRFDPFVERQLRHRRRVGKRLVVWLHSSAASRREEEEKLIAGLRSGDRSARRCDAAEGVSGRDMIHEVTEALKPQRVVSSSAQTRVNQWSTCSPRSDDVRSTETGGHRARLIATGWKCSSAGATTAADRVGSTSVCFAKCDGVLCRGAARAPDQWLFQTVPDVLFAEQQLSRPPML